MNITGNRETGGRTITADLAAAARRPDSGMDRNEEPVVNEERIPAKDRAAKDRSDERMRQSAGEPDLAPETRPEEADSRAGGRWFGERGTPSADRPQADGAARSGEALEPLFTPELAATYRSRWTSIQSGFVDDPWQAVRSGDELVAQMMTNLADTFAEERHRVETQLDLTGEGSTEELRVTLRRYRSFFERLLSL